MTPTALDRIFTAYTEPTRHYHTLNHISDMLIQFRRFLDVQHMDPRSVQALTWAIFYHDIVYDSTNPPGSNERQSSNLMQEDMADAGVEQAVLMIGVHAVISTIDHYPKNYNPSATGPNLPLGSYESNVMVDLDLAALGYDWKTYKAASENVRREFSHLSDGQWLKGRATFLNSFLERETIYHTAWGQARFEKQARKNLKRELKEVDHEIKVWEL